VKPVDSAIAFPLFSVQSKPSIYIIEREHNNLAMESKTTANNNNSTMPEGMGCRVPYLFLPFLVR
jgi:hypothetical protein